MKTKKCWCGNEKLEIFSEDYVICTACESLILSKFPAAENIEVKNDESDFYGKQYFSSYVQKLGYPDLAERARTDLPERCLYWLDSLLKYKLPPGKVLELGCAHGGFVSLLNSCGFEAKGLELSPCLSKYAMDIFGIEVLIGPIEQQSFLDQSFDIIALMDVLEHIPDPIKTLGVCFRLLKPDGIILIQTPRFPAKKSYAELINQNDEFVKQLKPKEHLILYSENSVRELFMRVGLQQIVFEQAIFKHYDMYFVASREILVQNSAEMIEKALLSSPSRRHILAILDLRKKLIDLSKKYESSEGDRKHWQELYYQLKEKN